MLDYERLKNNIIDMLVEQQLKLGYMRESVTLYYPLESLQELLADQADATAMLDILSTFAEIYEKDFGKITFMENQGRFCIRILPQGGAYVHALIQENADAKYLFLKDFLEKLVVHGITIDELVQVFRQYSDRVVVCQMREDDFDYLVYFENGMPDDYRYCIKFEGEHVIYHRFSIEAYEKLGFNTY